MAEAKSIETLSVLFTAGVVAGTLVSGPFSRALPALLLPLLVLPILLRRRMARLPEKQAVAMILPLFLLLGVFCALLADVPGVHGEGWLRSRALASGAALRAFIDTLPFPDARTAPLLKALLTGDRSGLSADTVALFRESGASHLLALSGLHVGIIYLLLDKAGSVLGASPLARKLRFAAVVAASGWFTLMTGASPSIVRAFLFILINEVLRLTLRPRRPLRVLCLALLIQLVLDPSVVRSTGFQLSYLAMAGIFLLYPRLESWYPAGSRWNPLRRLWQSAALAISCQLFTAPLAWLRFHSFPRYFLLTNLLAIPLTTGLMVCALATLGLWALGACPALLITATDGLGRLLLSVLEVIATL